MLFPEYFSLPLDIITFLFFCSWKFEKYNINRYDMIVWRPCVYMYIYIFEKVFIENRKCIEYKKKRIMWIKK